MQLKTIVFAAVQIVAVLANPLEHSDPSRSDPSVHTATKIFHTIISKSPFLVDRTSTIVWTESASISVTDSSVATSAPTPTIGY